MPDICGDNSFKLIEKYKKRLIEATNIEDRPEEMAVIDSVLFRFWQMDWLDKLELSSAQPERKVFEEMSDVEFEKWLYEHGICNPDIHESIPCSVVPLLIDNAINELSTLPTQTNVHPTQFNALDCVSRQDAIRAVKHAWAKGLEPSQYIEELPSVQSKTGRWINGKCSNCGERAPYWPLASTYYQSNYCPNCGQEMDVVSGNDN